MFELNVDVRVTLSSGAVITLSPEQERDIRNHVVDMVLGKQDRTIFPSHVTKRKSLKNKKWTEEEEKHLMDIVLRYIHIPKDQYSASRALDLKKFHKTITPTRTRNAVTTRYCAMRDKYLKDHSLLTN